MENNTFIFSTYAKDIFTKNNDFLFVQGYIIKERLLYMKRL